MEFFIDEAAITKLLTTEHVKLGNSYVEASYEIKDDKLIITSGSGGNAINTEELIEQIKAGM